VSYFSKVCFVSAYKIGAFGGYGGKYAVRIGIGIIAQGLGKDVEVADKAGVNAVENNALATGAVLLTVAAVAELIDTGVTTYDAWQLKKAVDEGRNDHQYQHYLFFS
jgi:hypothetical protein